MANGRFPALISAADAATHPDAWMHLAFDLGRHWAWEWWNVLLSRPARQSAGVADEPLEAVPDQLWRLLGRDVDEQDAPLHVPWLTPSLRVIRTTSGMALDPGEFLPGERVVTERVVQDLAPGERVVRPTPGLRRLPLSDLLDSAADRIEMYEPVGPGPAGDPGPVLVERLTRLGRLWLADTDAVPAPGAELLQLDLAQFLDADVPVELVAAAAAAAFLAGHGVQDMLGIRAIADWNRAAVAQWAQSSAGPAGGVLLVLERVAAVLEQLYARLATPPGWGGRVVLATPSPRHSPVPVLAVDSRTPPGG